MCIGTGKFLGFLEAQQIAPHIPVWHRAQRTDGTFSHGDVTSNVERDVNEDIRDDARALSGAEAFRQSSREREKLEMLVTDLKRQMSFERLRLRGLSGASDEVLLAATVRNRRRLARRAMPPPKPASAM